MPRLARQHSTQILPFLDGRTVKKVTGAGLARAVEGLGEQATEAFEREAQQRRERGLTASRALTGRGIRQVGPRYSPDGAWIAYTSGTLTRFPQLRLVRPDGKRGPRARAAQRRLGPRVDARRRRRSSSPSCRCTARSRSSAT